MEAEQAYPDQHSGSWMTANLFFNCGTASTRLGA